jgi:hypothetical protein
MNRFNDRLLSEIARISQHISPIDHLLNKIVDVVVPQAQAQACGGGVYLGSGCTNMPCNFSGEWFTYWGVSYWSNGSFCYEGCYC